MAAASPLTRLSKKRGGGPAAALSLLQTSLLVGTAIVAPDVASAWKECVFSPQDEWRKATEPTPARLMRNEYERRYTCNNEEGTYILRVPVYYIHA